MEISRYHIIVSNIDINILYISFAAQFHFSWHKILQLPMCLLCDRVTKEHDRILYGGSHSEAQDSESVRADG